MTRLSWILPIVFCSYIMLAAAGPCLSKFCCYDEESGDLRDAPIPIGKTCLNRPPPGGLWACEDPSITFPTAECLAADIKLCGIIDAGGAQTMFYSFGADYLDAKKFGDSLTPTGNFYNDVLEPAYWGGVLNNKDRGFLLRDRARRFVFIARSAQALGKVASGEVLLVVENLSSTGSGIIQDPESVKKKPDDGPNIWLTYELPNLQRNGDITRIVSIATANNNARLVEWENQQPVAGFNIPLLPVVDADMMPVPLPAAPITVNPNTDTGIIIGPCRDDAESNLGPFAPPPPPPPPPPVPATTTPSSAPTTPAPAPTPAPSCVLHGQDPDQGITQPFCLCDGSSTLSPLSVGPTGHPSDSCAYTTLPATATESITTFASTFTKDCQVCTQIAFNAPACQSVPQCTPTKAQLTVQAGSSPVHVGTLTGTALYTSVSSALEKLCPSVTNAGASTACTTDSVVVPKIDFVDAGILNSDGQLVIKVASSSYNSTAFRDAMIQSAALTAQKGSEGASACYTETYEVTNLRRSEHPPSRIFGTREVNIRDHPHGGTETGTFCNTAAFAGVGYFSAEWRQAKTPGAEAFIDATWEFHNPPGGNFLCDFMEDLEVALVTVAPEFATGDLALLPEIQAYCNGEFGL